MLFVWKTAFFDGLSGFCVKTKVFKVGSGSSVLFLFDVFSYSYFIWIKIIQIFHQISTFQGLLVRNSSALAGLTSQCPWLNNIRPFSAIFAILGHFLETVSKPPSISKNSTTLKTLKYRSGRTATSSSSTTTNSAWCSADQTPLWTPTESDSEPLIYTVF